MNAKLIHLALPVPMLGWVVASEASAEIVGWWKCDEGTGTMARDASRYGNDVSPHGDPQWATGHFEGALEFDGAGDYLDRGVYAPTLDIVGTLTVTAWVKPAVVLRDHEICGNVTAGPNGGGYMLGIYSNDRVELEVWSSAGTSAPANRPGGGVALQAGTWYFLAATHPQTADGGVIRTYVNGVFDQELVTTIVMAYLDSGRRRPRFCSTGVSPVSPGPKPAAWRRNGSPGSTMPPGSISSGATIPSKSTNGTSVSKTRKGIDFDVPRYQGSGAGDRQCAGVYVFQELSGR